MHLLQAGDSVIQLRFFPDSRHLLACVASEKHVVNFDVWTLPDGGRVRLPVPELEAKAWWNEGTVNSVAIHPSGVLCYIARAGRLFSFRTADGTPLAVPEGVPANQVILSPGGDRLLTADLTYSRQQLAAVRLDARGGTVLWQRALPARFRQVAAFLPDGEHFVTIADTVSICSFATGDEQAVTRYPSSYASQPQLSPDGQHLGAIGYGSMYLFAIAALGKPRRITSTRTYGNFKSFAFHPDGRTLAVIHGGPTLLKIYNLETLRLAETLRWKLGPLESVAFSPDGRWGAAGSQDGRIVLWEVGGPVRVASRPVPGRATKRPGTDIRATHPTPRTRRRPEI
jgi:WD40 repeat protein